MVERKTGVPDSLPATKPGVRTYQEAERLLFLCLTITISPHYDDGVVCLMILAHFSRKELLMLFEVKHLSHRYADGESEILVLDDVNLSFDAGLFYTITGESGSGKTTLLSLMGTLETLQQGELLFQGQPVSDPLTFRQKELGFVFQSYNLISYMTARENVEVALNLAKKEPTVVEQVTEMLLKSPLVHNDDSREETDDIYRLLGLFGLDRQKANRIVTKLSGDEQQRVAIARAVAKKPSILLCDEPTGNLDQKTSQIMVEYFTLLAHTLGMCVIVVTHDPRIADCSDSSIVLDSIRKGPVMR